MTVGQAKVHQAPNSLATAISQSGAKLPRRSSVSSSVGLQRHTHARLLLGRREEPDYIAARNRTHSVRAHLPSVYVRVNHSFDSLTKATY